jgi:hypothetical protein
MNAKAPMSLGWRVRMAIMAAGCAVAALWFLYDGFVAWPKEQELYNELAAFRLAHEKTVPDWREKWNTEVAEKRGLPKAEGEDPYHAMNRAGKTTLMIPDLLFQKILGVLLVPAAIMVIRAFLATGRRWVACDDRGVTTSDGDAAGWQAMTKLDKRRWPRKGIAYLHYRPAGSPDSSAAAAEKRILLDDFKFDRGETEKIVRAIEEHLQDDQIIGDIRETERDKRKAEKAAAEKAPA